MEPNELIAEGIIQKLSKEPKSNYVFAIYTYICEALDAKDTTTKEQMEAVQSVLELLAQLEARIELYQFKPVVKDMIQSLKRSFNL